jgi:hypothetical protein
MHTRRRYYLRRCEFVAALLAAALCLTACGSATPSTQRQPSPNSTAAATALGRALGQLDRLVVVRSNALPQNHIGFSFPARVTVSNPAKVQAVARALLALPPIPSGAFAIPIDLGITYRLIFATAHEQLAAISVDATGVEAVRGLGPTRWVSGSAGFWTTLGKAMGLAHPGYDAFRGTMPNA